jgi:hypothetical protein
MSCARTFPELDVDKPGSRALALELMGKEEKANFVGQWAPSLLILGLYNKMVKLHGSDGA